jgi:hypothetical protein
VRAPGPALDTDDHKELDGLMARLERKLKERSLGETGSARRRAAG